MERLVAARSLTTFDVAGLAQFARQLEEAERRGGKMDESATQLPDDWGEIDDRPLPA